MMKKRLFTSILCLVFIAGITVTLPNNSFARGRSTAKRSKAPGKAKARSSKASSSRTGNRKTITNKTIASSRYRGKRMKAGKRIIRPMTAPPRSGSAIPPDRVSEIQTALKREGYYQGDPNGQYDRATIEAMTNYQKDKNLRSTGYPTAESLQKLGLSKNRQSAPKSLPDNNKQEQSRSNSDNQTDASQN